MNPFYLHLAHKKETVHPSVIWPCWPRSRNETYRWYMSSYKIQSGVQPSCDFDALLNNCHIQRAPNAGKFSINLPKHLLCGSHFHGHLYLWCWLEFCWEGWLIQPFWFVSGNNLGSNRSSFHFLAFLRLVSSVIPQKQQAKVKNKRQDNHRGLERISTTTFVILGGFDQDFDRKK